MTRKLKKSNQKRVRGLKLGPNAGSIARYRDKLRILVDRMTAETARKVVALFKSPTAQEYQETIAMDASVSSQARILMNELTKKYNRLFALKAKDLAEGMVKDQLADSKRSLKKSLKHASQHVALKGDFFPPGLREIAKASVAENIMLIKSVSQRYMLRVQGAVMRSISAGEGSITDIRDHLTNYEGITERQVKNIADDQTRKAFNSVNSLRSQASGAEEFEWLHSGGGQKPRQSHIELNGKIFRFDDPPVINPATGKTGMPGEEPNCRCTFVPVFKIDKEE